MLTDTMEAFGLSKDFSDIGFFETEHYKKVLSELRNLIKLGKMVTLSGIVGSGKSTIFEEVQRVLIQEKDFVVVNAYSVEKHKVNLVTLMTAIFSELATNNKEKIPTQAEKRERKLRELIARKQKPVVLFIDEAHDLHSRTLVGLKRLMEVVRHGGTGSLSIILAGHPKLRNSLRCSSMEEIGARTEFIDLEPLSQSEKHRYIEWLVNNSLKPKIKIKDVIQEDAIKVLCGLVSTPLQFKQHLRYAFETAHKAGQKPVTAEIIESIVLKDIDDLEPKLVRLGYSIRGLSELLTTRPSEVRLFLDGKLPTARSQEFQNSLRAVGIPI